MVALGIVLLGLLSALSPLLSLCLLLGVSCVILVFLRPLFGVFLLFPLLAVKTFYVGVDNPYRAAIDEWYPIGGIPIVLAYVLGLVRAALFRQRSCPWRLAEVFLGLFICWSMISLFWVEDFIGAPCALTQIFLGVMTMVTIERTVTNLQDFYKVLRWIVVCGIGWAGMMTACTWYQGTIFKVPLIGTSFLSLELFSENGRLGGIAPSPFACSTLGTVILLMLPLFIRSGWRGRCLLLLTAFFFLSDIMKAASKAAIAGLWVGFSLAVLLAPRTRRWTLSIVGTLTAVLIFVQAFNIVVFGRAGNRLTSSGRVAANSLTSRLGYWQVGFDAWFDTGGWGEGVGDFARIMDPIPGPHSFYLEFLFQLGIPGFLLFAGFMLMRLLRVLRTTRRHKDEAFLTPIAGLLGALCVIMIQSLVDLSFWAFHFWLVMGLLESLVRQIRSKMSEGTPHAFPT